MKSPIVKTGRARIFQFPRVQFGNLSNVVNEKGIYILWKEGNSRRRPELYVGKSNEKIRGVYGRLYLHDREEEKNFWRHTFVVTNDTGRMTKNRTKYLEFWIFQRAIQAEKEHRCTVRNVKTPEEPSRYKWRENETLLEDIVNSLPMEVAGVLDTAPVTAEYESRPRESRPTRNEKRSYIGLAISYYPMFSDEYIVRDAIRAARGILNAAEIPHRVQRVDTERRTEVRESGARLIPEGAYVDQSPIEYISLEGTRVQFPELFNTIRTGRNTPPEYRQAIQRIAERWWDMGIIDSYEEEEF